LDHVDARRLQVEDLVTDGERELLARLGRGWSSRTNDHASMVTGPVSMPLSGLSMSDEA
jgi:hypothetical protein